MEAFAAWYATQSNAVKSAVEVGSLIVIAALLALANEGLRILFQRVSVADLKDECTSRGISDERMKRRNERKRWFPIRLESLAWYPVGAIAMRVLSTLYGGAKGLGSELDSYIVVAAMIAGMFCGLFVCHLSLVRRLHLVMFVERDGRDLLLRSYNRNATFITALSWIVLAIVLAGWSQSVR